MTEPRDPEGDSSVQELVFEYLERADEAPERASAMLEELCASKPEHARELQRRIASLIGSGLWLPVAGAEAMPATQLGEFELVRRLGQGGMGVVYLAEQRSVGRRVALKLVKSDQLFYPNTRERFLREVQAIARLDHPGIVQVLSVGEAQGTPYFAMEYVAGLPLDQLIDGWSAREPAGLEGADVRAAIAAHLAAQPETETLDLDAAAFERGWVGIALRIVRDVALALHHAHQRGVLHRDVKPSNVILEPSGRVRLLDFGLAALSSAERITRSGAQLGSLTYMSPEQIDGRKEDIGTTTDVYSLGVTLYELLTLRLPYRGESFEQIRHEILNPRPASIRKRNSSVPVDVETVCLKAMERDVEDRYASALDLAHDIENVLELRPIQARPPSTHTRLVRWTQRRPATAVAIALGTLLLLAGPIGYEVHRVRSFGVVQAAYERSERDFRSVLDAIGHVLRATALEELEDVPRMQRARLAQIDRALEVYADLERERPEDLQVLSEGGELHASRAAVLSDLGQTLDARRESLAAIDFHRRAFERDPGARQEVRLVASLVTCGKSHGGLLETRAGLPFLDEAVARSRARAMDDPRDTEWRDVLIASLAALAELHALSGDDAASRAAIEEALVRSEQLEHEHPSNAYFAWNVGRCQGWLVTLASRAHDDDAWRRHAESSLAAFERAASLSPNSRYFVFEVAYARVRLAEAVFARGETAEGEAQIRAALTTLDELLRDFPESARYHDAKCRALQAQAIHHTSMGRAGEARALLAAIAEEREVSASAAPDRGDLAVQAAVALNNLAFSILESGEGLERALEIAARAEERLASRRDFIDGSVEASRVAVMLRYVRALTLVNLGRLSEAAGAISEHAELVDDDPAHLRYAADLWNEYALAAEHVDLAPGDPQPERAEAVARMFDYLERAVDAGYDQLEELDGTPALDAFRDTPEFQDLRTRLAETRAGRGYHAE